MDNLPDNVRKSFEQYIRGNKKEALEQLIPGSEYHSYLSIIDSFKNCKGKIDAKTKDMIAKFKKNWPGFESQRVELQSYLLQYDFAKNDSEKEELIQKIDNEFIHGYYQFSKPAEIKGIKEIKRERSRSPSRNLNVNNTFDQDKYFNEETTLKSVYKYDYELSSLQRSLLNKVDFKKISDKAFNEFLSTCPYLSELTTKSFMDKLVAFLKKSYRGNKHFILNTACLDKLTAFQLQELGNK